MADREKRRKDVRSLAGLVDKKKTEGGRELEGGRKTRREEDEGKRAKKLVLSMTAERRRTRTKRKRNERKREERSLYVILLWRDLRKMCLVAYQMYSGRGKEERGRCTYSRPPPANTPRPGASQVSTRHKPREKRTRKERKGRRQGRAPPETKRSEQKEEKRRPVVRVLGCR